MIGAASMNDGDSNVAVDKVIEEPKSECDAGASSKKRVRGDESLSTVTNIDINPDMLALKRKMTDLEKKLENTEHDFKVMNNFFKYASQGGDYESWWFWDAQREARGETSVGQYSPDDPEHPNDILKSV